MAHLAARAGLVLPIEMHMRATFGDELAPAVDLAADEVLHACAAAREARDSWRKIADRADMLLELGGDRAFDRPVPTIVNSRCDLVDERPIRRREKFHSEHADMTERLGDPQR